MTPTLTQLLREWALVRPQSAFLGDTEQALTFAEAWDRVQARAEGLAREVGEGAVAVEGGNSVDGVVTVLAALHGNVPVYWIPEGLAERERAQLLESAHTGAIWQGGGASRLTRAAEPAEGWRRSGAALGFVTSGSTGAPRLALRSAASLADEGQRYRLLLGLAQDATVFCAPQVAHAFGFGASVAAALCAGCRLIVHRAGSMRGLARTLRSLRPTFVPLVRPLASALCLVDGADGSEASMSVAMVGAGPCPQELSERFRRAFGVGLGRNYGSSETGALLAALPEDGDVGTGRPMPGVLCEITRVDGELGELWVKTETPPLGHLGEGGFEPARLGPHGYWKMGDLCRTASEGVEILGRADHCLRRGGHTIVPSEVERVIAEHPAVAEVQLCVGDPPAEGGEPALVASVQLHSGSACAASELADFVKPRVSAFKRPTEWRFVEAFPRTWSGKTKRAASAAPGTISRPWRLGLRASMLAYRATEAVLCAAEVGLLEALLQPSTVDALASSLGLGVDALGVFLEVLEELGVAREASPGSWLLCASRAELDREALDLERELRDSWLRSTALVDALRVDGPVRAFDREGPTAVFTRAYQRVICGRVLHGHLLRVCRPLRREWASLSRPIQGLDIGRALGAFAAALPEAHIERVGVGPRPIPALEPGPTSASDRAVMRFRELALPEQRYDVIHVGNAIHWLPARLSDAVPIVAGLMRALRPGGHLLITDVFIPRRPAGENFEGRLWRLDWLTHGGLSFRGQDELQQLLEAATDSPISSHSRHGCDFITFDIQRAAHAARQQGEVDRGRHQATTQGDPHSGTAAQPDGRIAP